MSDLLWNTPLVPSTCLCILLSNLSINLLAVVKRSFNRLYIFHYNGAIFPYYNSKVVFSEVLLYFLC